MIQSHDMKKQFQKSTTATTATKKPTTAEIQKSITDAFVESIQKTGTLPWQRPWKRAEGQRGYEWVSRSRNLKGYHYKGINAMILDAFAPEIPVWGTFKQWKETPFFITKGEKGTITVLWLMFWVKQEPNGKLKYINNISEFLALSKEEQQKYEKRFKLSYDKVFHIGQINAGVEPELPENASEEEIKEREKKQAEREKKFEEFRQTWAKKFENKEKPAEIEPEAPVFFHEKAEQIVKRWDVRVRNLEQDEAYYSPSIDMITMPLKEQFFKESEYYSVLFHEGCHASGHEKRLKRDGIVNRTYFGSKDYSFEELVAEIGTAFICSELNIEKDFENSAAYVKSWVSNLQSNPDWIIRASSQAASAADWVLGWLDSENTPTEIEETEAAEMEA